MTHEIIRWHDAKAAALEAWGAFVRLGRQTVEQAWATGDALLDAKDTAPEGEWLTWLEANEIPTRTAQRLMRLRNGYETMRQLDASSVSEALKAISKPKEPKPNARNMPQAAIVDERERDWEAERDDALVENRRLAARLELAEARLEVATDGDLLSDPAKEALALAERREQALEAVKRDAERDHRAKLDAEASYEELQRQYKRLVAVNRRLERERDQAIRMRDEMAEQAETDVPLALREEVEFLKGKLEEAREINQRLRQRLEQTEGAA